MGEVEDYSRVQITGIQDLTLVGQAASDVAHLLAELVENATSFSPTTMVEVTGGPTGNGYVVEIEDHGIGMSDAELDEANGAGPAVGGRRRRVEDDGLPRGRPPRGPPRHRVQLRHCWFGGVTALVLLPAALLGSAGEQPAMAPPVPAGVMASPESLLLANTTKSASRAPTCRCAGTRGRRRTVAGYEWRRWGRRAGRVGATVTMGSCA